VRLLRQGPFALLCAGSALNAIGSWAAIIAIWGFASSHFHASATQIALLGLAWSAPAALVGPLAGVPIDRFGPRVVLLASDAVGVATALGMASADSFGILVGLSFLSGLVQAAGGPAGQSLPPRLVDDTDLMQANALLVMADQSAIVLGPLVAAAVIAGLGVRAAFYVDAITFVVGAVSVLPLRLRPLAAPSARASVWREVRDGLQLARSRPAVRRTLVLAAAVFASWGAFFVLEPLYVRDVLHRSSALLGLFQTAFGIGLLTTTALLPRLGDRLASIRALAVSVVVSGVAAATYVGTRVIAVAFVGVVAWGVDVAFFLPPMQVVLQRATPTAAHGRILALSSTADGVANVIAIPLTGACVGLLGVQGTGVLVGALAVVAGLAGWAAEQRAERAKRSASSDPAATGSCRRLDRWRY
jgi:predicted MFS family arabinose efflux permease